VVKNTVGNGWLHEGFLAHAKVEVYWIENDPTPNQVKIMWEAVTSNYLYRLYGADDVSRPYTGGWFSFFNRMSRRVHLERQKLHPEMLRNG